VITRRDARPASVTLQAGSFGMVAARGHPAFGSGAVREVIAAASDRSDGFMFERGCTTAGFSSRTSIRRNTGLFVS
jgi:hypothetical protein